MVRRRFSWVIAGAVVAVGVFAGLDALRSSGGKSPPTSSERDRAVTTTPTETAAVLLTEHRPVRLIPGLVSTALHSSPVVTFMVPPGWYGYQDETGFVLGMGLVGEEVDLVPGGISVRVLDISLARAARRLEQLPGLRIYDVSPVRIGGYAGRKYSLLQLRDGALKDFGASGVVPPSPDLILLGAGRKTLVIRRPFTTDAARAEVSGVLMSFRSPG
jgi:hypothetical protein